MVVTVPETPQTPEGPAVPTDAATADPGSDGAVTGGAAAAAGATDADDHGIRTLGELHQAARYAGGYWFSLASSVYLGFLVFAAWREGTILDGIAVTALCIVLAGLLLLSGGARRLSARSRWRYVGLTLAAILALIPFAGWATAYTGIYLTMTFAVVLDWRHARLLIPVATAVLLVITVPRADWFGAVIAALALVMGMALGSMIHQEILQDRLDAAQRRNATLAVAAERERIGRDLHDILGHSLTVIAMTAQVAQRLTDKDPAAARERMAEVEDTARQALADVRATASNLREVRLATELSAARSVLTAADLRADTPASLPPLEDPTSELLGYALREAVTNVVRHARATSCTITVTDTGDRIDLTVRDDGVGIGADRRGDADSRGIADRRGDAHLHRGADLRGGSGLRGLRARLGEAGGTLTVRQDGTGTVLTASVLHRGPHEASNRRG